MGEGNALYNWAVTLYKRDERADAVRRAQDALTIFEAIGAKHLAEKARARLAEWSAVDGRS